MDNYFLVGLSLADGEMQRNVRLLKERSWFDILIVYADGKRALVAIEKGPPGERAFSEAFAAWDRLGDVLPGAVGPAASADEPKRVHTVPITPANQGTASSPDRPLPLPWPSQAAVGPVSAWPGTPAAVSAGGYVVVLTAVQSETDAQSEFRRLQEKYPSVLGGRELLIRRRDQGERGVDFVAQIGPFEVQSEVQSEADQLCRELKYLGGTCFVANN